MKTEIDGELVTVLGEWVTIRHNISRKTVKNTLQLMQTETLKYKK